MTFGINGAELIILIVLALLILGPEKLPDYARKMTQWIRQMRQMAEGAKNQFKEETGTDFDEIDWRRYDPRQYDPRRIIKEALAEPVQDMRSTAQEVWDHEAVREDLKTMDPRDLVRGKTGRTSATSAQGTGSSGAGSTALGAAAVAAGTAAMSHHAEGEPDPAEQADGADAPHGASEPAEILPAPFDTEAT
ncbi:Sec-independent protein translocase protein TatB [Micrococcus terreus]|uniref:Sec-independent protein translocase protein TatB n=1 Tax=Micrococcus terreus TaxID=574650 RepID=UPI0033F41916